MSVGPGPRRLQVRKLGYDGALRGTWSGELQAWAGPHLVLCAVWTQPVYRDLDVVTFEPGDVFLEHYYLDRWYAIWRVEHSPERGGGLKCWYCNVSTPPELQGDTLSFRDLALDLVVLPDGTTCVLDRDEFEALRATTLDPASAAQAEAAVEELLARVTRREPPFDGLAPAKRAGAHRKRAGPLREHAHPSPEITPSTR